jgi:virginiamycin A acetyltransferase
MASNIVMGKHSYGDIRMVGGNIGQVKIGKYCSLGEDVQAFMSFDHNIDNISTFPFNYRPNSQIMTVNVGNDVWIGSHTVLFKGVKVGDGSIIGAYSKITKDIPPYSVVVGDSRILRKRFSDEDIRFLLKIRWWDFTDKEVEELKPILHSPDIHVLRRMYGC